MNKTLKLSLVVVLLLAVVLVAQNGAWAGKLQSGAQAPSAVESAAGARPVGTSQGQSLWVAGGGAVAHQGGFQGNLPLEMRSGAPDGTVYLITPAHCGEAGLVVNFATGPNWTGTVSYFNGGNWISIVPQGGDGDWTVTLPCGGPTYIVISPAA